jgi:Golgi nucleoside diphosphatase
LVTYITNINPIEGIDKLWDESDTPQQRKSKVKEYLKALLALAKAFAAGAQVDLKDLPIYLMGTAGLRDFKAKADDGNTAHPTVQEYDGFIATITACIKEEKFTQVSYCGIITGEFEAIYGWVAANYTLGAFSGNPDTVGYLEMGGASAQIAFRPHKNLEESKPYYQGEVTHVRVGTSDFYLYVKSYALGANKAWEHRDRLLRQAAGNSRTVCRYAIQC